MNKTIRLSEVLQQIIPDVPEAADWARTQAGLPLMETMHALREEHYEWLEAMRSSQEVSAKGFCKELRQRAMKVGLHTVKAPELLAMFEREAVRMVQDGRDYASRLANLDMLVEADRIIRDEWASKDTAGREMACWLSALSPEVAGASSPDACPGNVMPRWFANLVPSLADHGSELMWPSFTRQFRRVAHMWPVLTNEDWARVRSQFLYEIVTLAMDLSHVQYPESVQLVLDWIKDGAPKYALEPLSEYVHKYKVGDEDLQSLLDEVLQDHENYAVVAGVYAVLLNDIGENNFEVIDDLNQSLLDLLEVECFKAGASPDAVWRLVTK